MNFYCARALASSLLVFSSVMCACAQNVRPGSPTTPATGPDNNAPDRPKPKLEPVNGIVAKVNGEVITLNQLMIQVAPQQSVLMSRFPRRGAAYQTQLSQMKNLILNNLIDRTIMFSEFKDRISAVTDQQVEEEIKRIIDRQYNGDEALFRKYLQATHTTRDQFKQEQRREILVQIVRTQHFGDVPVPREEELREEYQEWKVTNRDRRKDVATYHRIYLRKDLGGGANSQLLRAERIMEKIQNGGDIEALAKVHSDDSHAQDGGLWKDIPRTDLNMEFGFILFESEGTKVMGPIEDQFGFNIIEVMEREFGPSPPFEEVRDQLEQRVVAEKKSANFEKWMKKMRARAVVEKML